MKLWILLVGLGLLSGVLGGCKMCHPGYAYYHPKLYYKKGYYKGYKHGFAKGYHKHYTNFKNYNEIQNAYRVTVTGNGEGSTYLPSQAHVYPPTYVKPTAYSYPAAYPAAYTHKTFVKTPATGYGQMIPHAYVPVKSHVSYPSNPVNRYVRGPTNYVLPGRNVIYVKPSAGIHTPPHAGYKPNTQLPLPMKYVVPKQPTSVKQMGTNHVASGQSGAVKGYTGDNGYLVHLYQNYGDGLKVKVTSSEEDVYKGVYAGSKV